MAVELRIGDDDISARGKKDGFRGFIGMTEAIANEPQAAPLCVANFVAGARVIRLPAIEVLLNGGVDDEASDGA